MILPTIHPPSHWKGVSLIQLLLPSYIALYAYRECQILSREFGDCSGYVSLPCWAHQTKAGVEDPMDLQDQDISLELMRFSLLLPQNRAQVIIFIVQGCPVYKYPWAGRLLMKGRLMGALPQSKYGWRGGECSICLRSTAAVLSLAERILWCFFTVRANKTTFLIFVTITRTQNLGIIAQKFISCHIRDRYHRRYL